MGEDKGRWLRLERYARWRQYLFPIEHLPMDVLGEICAYHLEPLDRYRFIEAFVGFPPDFSIPSHVKAIPHELRMHWVRDQLVLRFESFLYSISDLCMWHALPHSTVRVFADWSPFSKNVKESPVANVRWAGIQRPRACIHIRQPDIRRCIVAALTNHRPVSHIAIYNVTNWNRRSVIRSNRPLFLTSYQIIPMEILTILQKKSLLG